MENLDSYIALDNFLTRDEVEHSFLSLFSIRGSCGVGVVLEYFHVIFTFPFPIRRYPE